MVNLSNLPISSIDHGNRSIKFGRCHQMLTCRGTNTSEIIYSSKLRSEIRVTISQDLSAFPKIVIKNCYKEILNQSFARILISFEIKILSNNKLLFTNIHDKTQFKCTYHNNTIIKYIIFHIIILEILEYENTCNR